jgi:hypothetical protein
MIPEEEETSCLLLDGKQRNDLFPFRLHMTHKAAPAGADTSVTRHQSSSLGGGEVLKIIFREITPSASNFSFGENPLVRLLALF